MLPLITSVRKCFTISIIDISFSFILFRIKKNILILILEHYLRLFKTRLISSVRVLDMWTLLTFDLVLVRHWQYKLDQREKMTFAVRLISRRNSVKSNRLARDLGTISELLMTSFTKSLGNSTLPEMQYLDFAMYVVFLCNLGEH